MRKMRQIFDLWKSQSAVWYYEDLFGSTQTQTFLCILFQTDCSAAFSALNTFITVPLFCQTKTFFKGKGMRSFSPILITEVSVCGARMQTLLWQLLFIKDFHSRFLLFFWLHLPNLAQWLMAEGQLWSDEMEYTQHRLLERPVESWAHRITTWILCVSRRLKNVFVFALESSLNQSFQSISRAVRVIQQSEGNRVGTLLHISDILCRK